VKVSNLKTNVHLNIGGLVAAGLDPTGKYLLAVSHSGRGVFSTATWERLARNSHLAYPQNRFAVGIGPIDGLRIPVTEIDYTTGQPQFSSPDGKLKFHYQEGNLSIASQE
jgi:hypothetical protein